VDLDVDEGTVHHRRRRWVLEGLALHHVAPMARRVADRQQDRLVICFCPQQRFGSPRVPVHGVVRVLQQIRARLARQPVGHPVRGTLDGARRRRTAVGMVVKQLLVLRGPCSADGSTYCPLLCPLPPTPLSRGRGGQGG